MLRLIWNLSIHIRTFLRVWMPTNILLDALRTRRGLRWGVPAMLLSIGYLAIAYWCNTLIDDNGPGWLHLIVLLCIYNAFKFLIFGPLSLARLLKARHHERATRTRETAGRSEERRVGKGWTTRTEHAKATRQSLRINMAM